MGQGLPIAIQQGLALSTTESANQVVGTYLIIGAGRLRLFAKGTDNTVRCNFFVNGQQILRRSPVFVGTVSTLDTSANLVADVPTIGGIIELTWVATTGTPTVDFLLTYEGIPFGGAISRLFGRR
jgi:hypothetical protein